MRGLRPHGGAGACAVEALSVFQTQGLSIEPGEGWGVCLHYLASQKSADSAMSLFYLHNVWNCMACYQREDLPRHSATQLSAGKGVFEGYGERIQETVAGVHDRLRISLFLEQLAKHLQRVFLGGHNKELVHQAAHA